MPGGQPEEDDPVPAERDGTTNIIHGSVYGTSVQAGTIGAVVIGAPAPVARPSQHHLRSCLAQVELGGVVGAGTVISRRVVVTSASVFGDVDDEAEVGLPLFDADLRLRATVSAHRPDGLDLLVLRLACPPPQRLARVPFRTADDHWGNGARIVGIGESGVVNAEATLLGRRLDGWIQLKVAPQLENGFLGGPVWDQAVGGVVGVAISPDHVLPASAFAEAVGLRLDTADPEPPALAVQRRAYRLGHRHATATRVEVLAASAGRDGVLAALRAASVDDRDFLGLAEHRSEPGDDPRIAVQLARAADSRRYREDLTRTLGEEAENAFAAGFLLGHAAEVLPPAEFRARDGAALAARFTGIGLPADVGTAVTALITHPTAYAADHGEVGAVNDRVDRWFDDRLAGHGWTTAAHLAIWGFARHAALAAAVHERRGDERLIRRSLLAPAQEFGDRIDLDVPALPPHEPDDAVNGARALRYVLELAAEPNTERLARRYGLAAARLLEFGARLHAWLVFPEDDFRTLLARKASDVCAELRVPVEISTPLVTVLRSEEGYHAVKNAVFDFDAALTRHWRRTATVT